MPITLKQISVKTGFSISTVSHALTGRPAGKSRLSPETVAHVKQAARELGYRPNNVARSLKNSRTNTIGILVPNIRGDFYEAILAGINSVVFPDFVPILTIHQYNGKTERKMLETLLEKRVDGIIAAHSGREGSLEFYQEIEKERIPLILVDRAIDSMQLPLVRSDQYKATYDSAVALQQLGHKRIAYVRVTTTHLESTRLYEQGYRDAMAQAGFSDSIKLIACTEHTDWTKQGLSRIAADILSKLGNVTAIIANGDMLCYELIEQCAASGRRIPADISIMGMGDYYPSGLYGIELSTVRVDNEAIGAKAARLMLQKIHDHNSVQSDELVLMPCQVILRKTTGPAPA